MFKKPQHKTIAHTWMQDDGPAPSDAALAAWAKQNPGARFLPDDQEDMTVPGFARQGEMAERPEQGDRPGQQQQEQRHDVQFTSQHMPHVQHQMAPKKKPQFKPFAPGKPKFGK
jgi:hypothetical protein